MLDNIHRPQFHLCYTFISKDKIKLLTTNIDINHRNLHIYNKLFSRLIQIQVRRTELRAIDSEKGQTMLNYQHISNVL